MDYPVSAFAVYKSNKNSNKEKKNKKKKNRRAAATSVAENFTEETSIQVAKKIKQQQKKEPKNIGKKNTHKKKRSITVKNQKNNNKKSAKFSESEDVPVLIPAAFSSGFNTESPSVQLDSSSDSEDDIPFPTVMTDSVEEGFKVFKWMIAPYNPQEFLDTMWESKPLHIVRNKPAYYKKLISTPTIDNMLRNETIQFTKNIDITSYEDGQRETHNPEGRAHPHLVWDFYLNGCSIRLLNPQTYIPKLHLLNATMQEYFNSFVGANAYLTPPDSQGFAPHYDDIEAFILQAEGKKLWRIYEPRSDNEFLPRVSSKNFDQEEIGEPIMEVTLKAGDMLYFPRGYIHQGVTINGEHSLHVTISMYQKHSWADLLEKLVPAALQRAIDENLDLRRGLPFDIYDNLGLVHSDANTPRRKELRHFIRNLFDTVKNYLPIDDAVDQMNKHYQHDALPPILTDLERAVTVFGDSDVMIEEGKVANRVEMRLDDGIRLLRKGILRMVSEERIRIYYHVENSLEYHGNDLPFLEIEPQFGVGVETLINAYPLYVKVENLEMKNDADKIQLADALWSRGLIMTEQPMENIDDD